MKRSISMLLCLLIAGSVLAAQNSNTAPKKPKPAPVDCSTVDDATITSNVQAKLAKAASLKNFTINVATSAGVVTLTGSVKTNSNKGTATRVAKSAACVKSVDNQLTVETPPKSTTKNKNASM